MQLSQEILQLIASLCCWRGLKADQETMKAPTEWQIFRKHKAGFSKVTPETRQNRNPTPKIWAMVPPPWKPGVIITAKKGEYRLMLWHDEAPTGDWEEGSPFPALPTEQHYSYYFLAVCSKSLWMSWECIQYRWGPVVLPFLPLSYWYFRRGIELLSTNLLSPWTSVPRR